VSKERNLKRHLFCLLALALCALVLACGDDGGETTATAAPSEPSQTAAPTELPSPEPTPTEEAPPEATITVTLSDSAIELDVASGPAGVFTFVTTNDGTIPHELVIVDTDLAPDALPQTENGRFDLAGGGAVVLAQTPAISTGGTDRLSYELEAGNYVLISNLVNAEGEGDYSLGMYTAFTVE
jgi:glucose/arabinose dehydrogenase